MAGVRESIHGQWSNRWVFVLAATGSAVGLGNIWKFPYITGEYGGGAFVLIYLVCIAMIGIPIMMAEIMLGRRGRQSPMNTMHTLAIEAGHNPHWKWLGWMGIVAGFLILSYYSVIAGWAIAYVFYTGEGQFVNATADGVGSIFGQFVSHPETLLLWHTLFMVLTMIVVARGVRGGLEKAVRYLMPGLFILLLVMLGYAMNEGAFQEGLHYLFNPDFTKISWDGVLTALGHAFFTLSLGMGAIMVYGSYLPQNTSIAKASVIIALADTAVALLAGMVIFPIVFANGLEPGAGPGLIFQTLPLAFGHMPGGTFFGVLFFILLSFAAWSSSISLIEPAVAWMVENKGMERITAAAVMGIACWGFGILTVFSFNIWAFDFNFLGQVKENGIFDILDIATANFMLPLGGLFIAIFSVWIMNIEASRDELNMGDGPMYRLWRFMTRYIAPVGVIIIFLNVIKVI